MKKTLYLTLVIIFVAAIVSWIGRSFNTSETMNNPSYPMLVDSTEQLIAYDITDCRLDLACGQMPDTTNEQVIFCGASFQTNQQKCHFVKVLLRIQPLQDHHRLLLLSFFFCLSLALCFLFKSTTFV